MVEDAETRRGVSIDNDNGESFILLIKWRLKIRCFDTEEDKVEGCEKWRARIRGLIVGRTGNEAPAINELNG